ncbi:MAG: diaminopimelate decarboxylase [Nitriliruptorales bacterium]|nr:diaminopimelate decarboxylase [Nitriliruptorales bacterium]
MLHAEPPSQRLLALGGLGVEDLAERFGTPLYLLDRAELVGRMRAYRQVFGPQVDVVYAAKALCVAGVLQLATAEGLAIDVASAGELATAIRAEVPPERIVFHGNNKSVEELVAAAEYGVGRFVADSFVELERLSELGTVLDRDLTVLVRITPGIQADTHRSISTGQDDSKFGFSLSAGLAHEAVARALKLPGVELLGVHCHIGSQVFALEAFERAASLLAGLLGDVRDRHGVVLAELNLGGGPGIAYTDRERELPLERYAETLGAAVQAACDARGLPLPRLAVEPGRSIVGPAGVTLYTVGTVKKIPGVRTYLSVDGGMSDNPRPALYDARYTFAAAGRPPGDPSPETRTVAVAGKHCESGDLLARDVTLPADLAEGDLLAVAATGAYTFALASNYNRLPRPPVVLVGDGQAQVLVRRETLDEILARDVPLS